jgi:hypothetical protein
VIRFPARSTNSSPVQSAQTGSRAIQPPGALYPGVTRPRLSSAELRNAWSCTSTHPQAFKKCSGTLYLLKSCWHSVVLLYNKVPASTIHERSQWTPSGTVTSLCHSLHISQRSSIILPRYQLLCLTGNRFPKCHPTETVHLHYRPSYAHTA